MDRPIIQFGLETEVGIWRDGPDEPDVVADSMALVRSATEPGIWMRWDYGCEDPHADARGFRVSELRQDTDEADYTEQDSRRRLSFVEIKSDLVLGNGARFYNDHAHPEYCTPECSTVDELVAQDRAGERILMACARVLSERLGQAVRLYKNNTDFCGHSYGCHENYLVPRSLAWETLARGMQSFLVTRQVLCGAGKFGIEAEDRWVGPGFQVSQRSDFFSELQSVDTMQNRPLINTRDEPHADAAKYRRFHVIVGDANLCPTATRLKAGTTALVLEALALDPRRVRPVIEDPLAILKSISRDREFRWEICEAGRRATTALEIQREHTRIVRAVCDLSYGGREQIVAAWERAIEDLAVDFRRCRGRLDWVTKWCLVREFQESEGIPDDAPVLPSLDLEYHLLDRAAGLYYGLEAAGAIEGVPPEREVMRAVVEPPSTTRALARGRCVRKFGPEVVSAHWGHVTLGTREGPVRISLLDLFHPEDILRVTSMIEAAGTTEELRKLPIVAC